MREEPEGRRRRLAGWFDTRAGTVGLLIAVVLLTQAGLVYVAVDQIGSSDEPLVVQPAQNVQSPRSPISVEADPQHRVPAPAATRVTGAVEAETPAETGVDLARQRAEPQGVAPPLTGDEPPAADDVRPSASETDTSPPPEQAADEAPESVPGDTPARTSEPDSSDPEDAEQDEADEPGEQHPGHGPDGDGPPGQQDDGTEDTDDADDQPGGQGKGRPGN